MGQERWDIQMFETVDGHCPVRAWLDDLPQALRAAALAAIELELEVHGPDVCRRSMGRNLGDGIYELRIAQDAPTLHRRSGSTTNEPALAEVLLRIFFATDGPKVVLLVSGYDKLADPKPRRQNREIERAKKYLRSYRLEQKRLDKGRRR